MKNLIQEWFMPSLVVGLVALAGQSIVQEQEEQVFGSSTRMEFASTYRG